MRLGDWTSRVREYVYDAVAAKARANRFSIRPRQLVRVIPGRVPQIDDLGKEL
jgi:hypothetical protein